MLHLSYSLASVQWPIVLNLSYRLEIVFRPSIFISICRNESLIQPSGLMNWYSFEVWNQTFMVMKPDVLNLKYTRCTCQAFVGCTKPEVDLQEFRHLQLMPNLRQAMKAFKSFDQALIWKCSLTFRGYTEAQVQPWKFNQTSTWCTEPHRLAFARLLKVIWSLHSGYTSWIGFELYVFW